MSIQVLLSTMYQKDMAIVQRCNISTDVLIINQCDVNQYQSVENGPFTQTMISTVERGLSKSRNMALKNATGDICVICDEDVRYVDGFSEIIQRAFDELPEASIIVFNVEPVNCRPGDEEKKFASIKRIPQYKTYGSVHIAFRRNAVVESGLSFNELFGAGSGLYPMSEDSLFFIAAHRAKLQCYTYPAVIATVDFSSSSWFVGYDERYFYNIGAFLAEAYPKLNLLFKWYYPLRMKKLANMSGLRIVRAINCGVRGYRKRESYDDYFGKAK